ncbi:MAG: DUF669 domain-containing protein [Verrucomicrobia bacterium]|nr:DUF669 domain-containing protein [Verrucomicrobiota bacterium]
MAFLPEEFDVDKLPQGTGNFEPLPAGWYDASITKADLTDTKAGNGQYIKLRFDITGPTHQGRVVFGNLNIKNSSVKAEEIGRQQLGELMRAIGLPKVLDTDQLIGGHLSIKLSVRDDPQYGTSNEVKGYKAIGGSVPAMPVSVFARKEPAWAEAHTPPWGKK